MRVIEKTVQPVRDGLRIDRYLAVELPEFSRARLQALIHDGHVTLNRKAPRTRDLVHTGDEIRLTEPIVERTEIKPQSMALDVLFEDEDLIVINKPAGLVMHPGAGNRDGTLVNALLARCADLSGIGGQERPGIVHRLDKETSGSVVIAKNDIAHRHLSAQFAARTVHKVYLALVAGELRKRTGTVDVAIGRHPVHRQKMRVASVRGRSARTDYRVLKSWHGISLVECTLHSGRMHQVRVHLHHIGHPVLGDKVYGTAGRGIYARQMLHAWRLGFAHPRTTDWKQFEAPVPADFATVIERLS